MDDLDRVLSLVPQKISDSMNDLLLRPFSSVEVKEALFSMNPYKCPGKDGLGAGFFQKFWDTVGPDVCKEVLLILDGQGSLECVNETIICLILKVKDPLTVTDYRPISLCNVVCKIVTKMLTNRLREVLGDVISVEQSSFVPGRLITDNAMIGFECLNLIKRHKKGNTGFFALKADMAKAYDRVEWSFLYGMMRKLGFNEKWIALIRNCISTVHYSICINGKVIGNIRPSRGLRQGDPLSPFLFLICAEG